MKQTKRAEGAPHRPGGKGGRPTLLAAALLGDSIMDAALDHFVLRGVDGASLERIAAAAGVTKRTIYARYGSKEGLLHAVISRDIAPIVDDIVASIPLGSPREEILFVAQAFLEVSLTPQVRNLTLLIEHLVHVRPELISETARDRTKPPISLFRSLLEKIPPAERGDSDQLDFIARCLFDLLVLAPRTQILHGLGLQDTSAALAHHLARALDTLATGLPGLRAPGGGGTSPPSSSEIASSWTGRASET